MIKIRTVLPVYHLKLIILCIISFTFMTCFDVYALDNINESKNDNPTVFLEYQSYGEFSHRDTNFSGDDYDSIVGWWANRFILRYKQAVNNPVIRRAVFEPYFKATLAASENNYFWENNYVYGVGLENRLLDGLQSLNTPWLNWLHQARFYVEYIYQNYTKGDAESWIPDYDFRYGVDLWKEWNIPPEPKDSNLWGELWANIGWRDTNFSQCDYNAYTGGAMGRFGIKQKKAVTITNNIDIYLLPYVIGEVSISEKDYFWENRLNVGGGLRIMPVFRFGSDKEIIIRLFAEGLHTLNHFKGSVEADTPENDLRIGINFSYNLF